MAAQGRSTKVSHSFSRVLLLAYLLCAHPSSAVVIPKECLDTDIIFGLAESYESDKAWAKIAKCVTMLFKQNPEMAKEIQGIYDKVKTLAEKVGKVSPAQAGVFIAFVLSLYLAAQAFDMYYRKLPQRLENVREYRKELDLLYRNKIVPLLEDIDDLLRNWQEYQIENIINALLATLREINDKLSDFLRKIKAEKLKVIENEGKAIVVAAASGAVAVGSAVTAVVFPPAGVVMVVGYCATVGVGFVAAVASYRTRSDLGRLEKLLEKLQDETYKYTEQITIGERKVNKILMKSYRTVRPRSKRG